MGILYFEKRRRSEVAMAAAASGPCAQMPHLAMARRYAEIVLGLRRAEQDKPCGPVERAVAVA